MNNNNTTASNNGPASNTDWHRCWSEFAEGMRQMSDSIRAMEKIYQDTFVWDRPIQR